MAEFGKAVIGTIEIDNAYNRQRALELAVETRMHSAENAESIVKRAAVFAAFIDGKPEPTCAVDDGHAVVWRTAGGHPRIGKTTGN